MESYFNSNPNVHLDNYQGVLRLMPALNFTCNTAITSIRIGAQKVAGYDTPRIQIWRLDGNALVNTVHLSDVVATEHPGVYEHTLNEPISVQERDVVSVYEPRFSVLKLYNEVNAGIYPSNLFIDGTLSQPLPGDRDHPLLNIETSMISSIQYCVHVCPVHYTICCILSERHVNIMLALNALGVLCLTKY